MFDIGWTELLVIAIVALIVVGPKDLPAMFQALGRFTAKARSMARDFQRAMEDAARESGVKDVTKDLGEMTSGKALGLDEVEKAVSDVDKWSPDSHTGKLAEEIKAKAEETRKSAERAAEVGRSAEELERELQHEDPDSAKGDG